MRPLRSAYWVFRRELHEMLRAPLVYGKIETGFLNPSFIARGRTA